MGHKLCIFLLFSLPCKGQNSADGILKVSAPEVTVFAKKSSALKIFVEVKKGYHIQANKVNDEFTIPTTLEINEGGIIVTGKQSYPSVKKFKLEGTSDYLLVYDGALRITVPFKTREHTQQGKYRLDAKLRYQACDSKTCFSPKTVDFFVTINVAEDQ